MRAGHCAEGVCCDGACTATCNSCLQANTGQIDGKCTTVRAGVVHGTDCPGSAALPRRRYEAHAGTRL